jgi:hypothetical protein
MDLFFFFENEINFEANGKNRLKIFYSRGQEKTTKNNITTISVVVTVSDDVTVSENVKFNVDVHDVSVNLYVNIHTSIKIPYYSS